MSFQVTSKKEEKIYGEKRKKMNRKYVSFTHSFLTNKKKLIKSYQLFDNANDGIYCYGKKKNSRRFFMRHFSMKLKKEAKEKVKTNFFMLL